MKSTDLGTLLRNFFEQHLVAQRGLSAHTVLAYRDSWKLLLQFASRRHRKPCVTLTLADLKADTVRGFLDYLERERRSATATRNCRLAAVHAFFQYAAQTDPRYLAYCQSVLTVPFKRHTQHVPEYLERQEVLQIFAQINCQTAVGRRDDGLLRMLYNTGMRAQELVSLDVNHLRFTRPYHVRILGKGRKERTCPLWTETVQAIKAYLAARTVHPADAVPLFVNARGQRLSRFGLRHIITHRVAEAAKVCPSLFTRKVTPHTWRHTTAMHLLQSHVDLNMIRSWLGHASIETTNTYVEIDLEMKRKTLRAAEKLLPVQSGRKGSWQEDDQLMAWLSKL
ncbi:MAG: site-specific integrase [Verrucomicrobiales bacterium]|nr:site-specific integrase [Verrucomicrobiales bacterium]